MDFRNIQNGKTIPTFDYADQPEIVVCDNGVWLCTVTTAKGSEGAGSTFVGITKSTDEGNSWTSPKKILDSPFETSYSSLIKTPYGRVYCFFDFNTDGLSNDDVITNKNGERIVVGRYDMGVGDFGFVYSDDNGSHWSDFNAINVRRFAVDRDGELFGKGKNRDLFWNVSKPFFYGGKFYHALIKFEYKFGVFLYHSEGVLLVSDNLEYERDTAKIRWQTLPDGDEGLKTPTHGGLISEEQCYVPLSDGTLFCTYRTTDSHPCCTYSSDDGHTWEKAQYMAFSDGRLMRHPRAANFVWKLKNGRYLYWFHNNGGRSWEGRNPVWLCAGQEYNTPDGKRLRWSQPELFLYENDNKKGVSYPDLFEDNGRVFVTETQKSVARLHEIPQSYLEKLWDMSDGKVRKLSDGIKVNIRETEFENPLQLENGVSVILEADFHDETEKIYFDLTGASPKTNGLKIGFSDGHVFAEYGDGMFCSRAVFQRQNLVGAKHCLAVTVDTQSGVIYAVCDGKFLDGADEQSFGWTRIPSCMKPVLAQKAVVNTAFVKNAELFDRPLPVSEICMDYSARP